MGSADSICCHKHQSVDASPIDQTDIAFYISCKSDSQIKNSMHKISKLMAVNHFINVLSSANDKKQQKQRIGMIDNYLNNQHPITEFGYVIGNNLSLRRYYDPINNTLSGYEHYVTLYQFTARDSEAEIERNVTIKSIIENLQIKQAFHQYSQAQYNQKMIADLNCLRNFPGWRVKPKSTFKQMKSHLLYNYHRFMPGLNSSISLLDSYSLSKIAYLHNFMANQVCKDKKQQFMVNQMYGKTYCMEMSVENIEQLLYQTKSFVFFTGFIKFSPMAALPIIEGELKSKIQTQNNEQKGISQSKIKFIVKNMLESKFKYVFQEHLCYLPLSLFIIKSINADKNAKIIELEEYDKQFLIQKTLIPHPNQQFIDENKDKEDLNLQNYSNLLQNEIEDIFTSKSYTKFPQEKENNRDNTNESQISFNLTQQYYQTYKLRLNQERKMKQQSKCLKQPKINHSENDVEEQKQRQQRKAKRLKELEELQLLEQLKIPQIIPLDTKTQRLYSQSLKDYIDDNELVKFEQQILSVDRFWQLTTINLNNCKLTRIQHMKCFPNLQNVFLYSNYIQILQGFDSNHQIRILSLGRNKIKQLNNIDHLQNLRGLYVGCNSLNKSAAQYLERQAWKFMKSLSISFQCDERQLSECYTILMNSKGMPKLKQLHINNSSSIPQEIKHKLKSFTTKTQFTD